MTPRSILLALAALAVTGGLALALPQGQAQRSLVLIDPDKAQAELTRATRESEQAAARAARFASEASQASEAAGRTARETAALAAQIQQAEANIEAARARVSLARAQRQQISVRLAEKQEPTARLTAALQIAARRPLVLSALQPGSLKDLVHVRAVLDSAVPHIRNRTADLRGELEQGRTAELAAARSLDDLRASEVELRERRKRLATLENSQRQAFRSASGSAMREEERALALAEEARDIDGLVDRLDRQAALRRELAALPGPVLRPDDISAGPAGDVGLAAVTPSPTKATQSPPPRDLQLPVAGRTLAGFGAVRDSGQRNSGLVLAPVAGAQVVAPASGRVVFAGAYRGFGKIVIVEHAGGWTSLVTGLARVDVSVGQSLIGGSPIGVAGKRDEPITIELRRDGQPVNPLQFMG
jgi:septal ring factor EnvC (AmiA/AmiB activator)